MQDLGIELEVGTTWKSKLDPYPKRAREVDPATPLGLDLISEPLTVAGPVYEIVARMVEHERTGGYLDAGLIKLQPQHQFAYRGLDEDRDDSAPRSAPVGTVLSFLSEVEAGPGYFFDDSDPSVGTWLIRQLYIRQWSVVSAGDPNSYRRDPTTVRFRPIQRMQMWDDERDFDEDGQTASERSPGQWRRTISDYLLEVA